MSILDTFNNFFKKDKEVFVKKLDIPESIQPNNNGKKIIPLPTSRSSQPDNIDTNQFLSGLSVITEDYIRDKIPIVRNLYKVNEDVGSVFFDLIQLTNTGHTLKFHPELSKAKVKKMTDFIENASKNWGSGTSGIEGLVNKMIAQIWVGGALSGEWIPSKNLDTILNFSLVNPENIYAQYDFTKGRYEFYQKVENKVNPMKNLVRLNPNTYKYFGLISDEDIPYGVPPFLTALRGLDTQEKMKINIDNIMYQLGLLGYLEVSIDKPSQDSGESDSKYKARLEQFLLTSKDNVKRGFMDGVVVGYTGDHEFNFNSTTKNLSGVSEIFDQNQVRIANGLKTSPAFLGLRSTNTETGMGIVFTKMLSQLTSVQQILSTNLEHGYKLLLLLGGFDYNNYLKVEFKASTITDDLKIQQSREIKQRVNRALIMDGIIGQEQYAKDMGYVTAFSDNPIVPYDERDGNGDKAKKEQDREKDKDKSDRKGRDKSKDQPRRKDNDSKPRT